MSAMPTSANIRVNPDFMARTPSGDGDDSTVLVVSDRDPLIVAPALHRAARQIHYLDQHGREHHNDDQIDRDLDEDPDIDTPKYVHGIFLSPLGLTFILDYAGGEGRAFANAAARIITEELLRDGIADAEIKALPRGVEHGDIYLAYH